MEYRYLAEFLVDWIKAKNYKSSGDYDKIWDDLKKVFNEMVGTLWLGNDIIDGLCTGKVTEENKNWTNEDKELCKISVKILSYIDGIKIGTYANIVRIEGEENKSAVESYLRCIVGRTLLIKWFGGHCSRMKVAGDVLQAVDAWKLGSSSSSNAGRNHERCAGLDFKNLNIGGKYLWPQMEEWAKKTGKAWQAAEGVKKMNAVKEQGKNCGTGTPKDSESSSTAEDVKNLKELFGVESEDQLKQLVEDEEKLPKTDIKEALELIEQERKKNNDNWESVIYNKLQDQLQELFQKKMEEHEKQKAAKQSAVNQAGEDCSKKDKPNLCERVKCVTQRWKSGNTKKDYKDMWMEIGATFDGLVEAISKSNPNIDSYCNGNQWKGGTVIFPEMEACRLIARGLEYMYKIPKDKDASAGDQEVNKQLLKQTVLCAVMNAYADQLIERENESCPIKKGIDKAFQNSDKIKKETDAKKKGGVDYIKCERDTTYKNCEIGQTGKKDNVKDKLKTMLNNDGNITKTLTSICDDCSKDNDDLCKRVQCVTTNWFIDRIGPQGRGGNIKQTWCIFWEPDVRKRLGELSTAMSSNNEGDDDLCKWADEKKKNTMTETEKMACNYIVQGLKHIYEIPVDLKNLDPSKNRKEEVRKRKNSRIFHQTMKCFLLNAYADKLIKEVRRPCNITEDLITKAFNRGNGKKNDWCVEKKNGGDCVICTREPDLNCTLNMEDNLLDTKRSTGCEYHKNNIQKKLDDMLKKDNNITKTVTDINTINNNSCERTRCVAHKWKANRDKNVDTPWELFWNPDVNKQLVSLSEGIHQNKENVDKECNKIGVVGSASRKACQYIVRGLKHIYKIEKGTDEKNSPQMKEDNLIFHRTFSCILLNIFADEMQEKCRDKKKDIEQGITHAFQKSNDIKDKTSPCKTEGDLCPLCTRDKSYKDCKINVTDGNTIGKRMTDMLYPKKNGDKKVKEAVESINTICPQAAKPAATKPATTKPVVKATQEETSSAKGKGRKDDANESDLPIDKIVLSLGDDDTDHTKSSQDEDEDKFIASNNGISRVSVVNINTNVPAGPIMKDDEVNNKEGTSGGAGTPVTALSQTTSTGTDTQTPSGSHPGSAVSRNSDPAGVVSSKIDKNDPGAAGGGGPAGRQDVGGDPPAGLLPGAGGVVPGLPGVGAPAGSPGTEGSGAGGGGGGGGGSSGGNQNTGSPRSGSTGTWNPGSSGSGASGNENTGSPRPGQSPQATRGIEPQKVVNVRKEGVIDLFDLTPYLPLAPVFLGMSAMTYLLWKYFTLGKRRRRHRREEQLTSPNLEEQHLDHVDDQDGPHEYASVKERKRPRSVTKGRRKQVGKRVGHRTIIDIHLEVLDECQKGDLHSTKEDFFKILVQEFMGSEFMKEEKVQNSGFGFREKNFVPKEQVPSFRFRI
ncbi:SICA antigen [Plasmodium coatneyi]|uniref:SICA antigen n=1 Tax=Plasmodium coatneyi TaxID=208452 RepID=A0A1B1DV02_9APIC|nr:SICA antigen [Plasmodium coatneyi]ANQ06603.1 SICA antigen [Plasmodium coatneyi]